MLEKETECVQYSLMRGVLDFFSHMMIKKVVCVLVLISSLAGCSGRDKELTLATTTSVQDTGILDVLTSEFGKVNKCRVKVIAVGTGQAIRLAKDGNVDLILVHAPDEEKTFLQQGYGAGRYEIMSNDFVLVGPQDDPAYVREEEEAEEALRKIGETRATFVSRADESGTHKKEKELWRLAGGLVPGKWYMQAGTGMIETLRIANEKRGYTLTDRATYIAHRKELDLVILLEGDNDLVNVYSLIPVSQKVYPHVNYRLAMEFVRFVMGARGQTVIADYGRKEYGEALYCNLSISHWGRKTNGKYLH